MARDQPALPPQNNASLSSLPSIDNNTVRVTPVAAAKFREAVPNSSANFVRLDITPGGCTGFEYHLTVENSIEVNDVKSDLDGFTIVTKQNFLPLLEGATIDWQTTPDGQQGFSFDCPATRPSTSP